MKLRFITLSIWIITFMTTTYAQMTPSGITVTGVGNAYGTPDVAIIDMGVDIANEDITAATDEVYAITNKLLELFKQAGIETKDVRTAYFNVWRKVRYDSEGQETSPVFRVTNTLSVTVRDVSKVGTLLNESLTVGANTINGIHYTIANPEELEQDARSLAMQNAKARAAELAILSGVTLGKVLSINETPGYVGTPMPFASGRELGMSAAMPVTPGQLAVSVNITVTLEIIEP
jgi:uncharacterized protein YggE